MHLEIEQQLLPEHQRSVLQTSTFIISVSVRPRQVLQVIVYCLELFVSKEWTPTDCGLYALGAKFAPDIVLRYQLFRLVNPVLIHASLQHLAVRATQGNLITQVIIGIKLEALLSTQKTALIYSVSAVGGYLTSAVFSEYSLSVGASTAVFGLIGAQAVVMAAYRDQHSRQQVALFL